MRYIGVDFETTGTNHDLLRPIQVGIYAEGATEGWGSYIYTPEIAQEWSAAAQSIHNIKLETVLVAPVVEEVDAMLSDRLTRLSSEGTLVAVGYNVGNFDMEIMRRWLPRSWNHFGYRVLDLNALPFLVARNNEAEFVKMKERLNESAHRLMEHELGIKATQHDAVSDAVEAIMAMKLQQEWY